MSKEYTTQNKNIISNWGNILLDTTIIITALNYKKKGAQVNKFAYDLLKYLSTTNYQKSSANQVSRQFNVSAISIAEILEKTEESVSKSQKIVQALNANNLTILDFDEDVANIFNNNFYEKLGQKNQNDILKRWGEGVSKDNRQALNNDLMILASGLYMNVDVVLCMDKGMYKIGTECGIKMIYVNEKYFKYNSTYFFEYFSNLSDKDFV